MSTILELALAARRWRPPEERRAAQRDTATAQKKQEWSRYLTFRAHRLQRHIVCVGEFTSDRSFIAVIGSSEFEATICSRCCLRNRNVPVARREFVRQTLASRFYLYGTEERR
jgi:hypothetical protein